MAPKNQESYTNGAANFDDEKKDLEIEFGDEPPPYIDIEWKLKEEEKAKEEQKEEKVDKFDVTKIEFDDGGQPWKEMTKGQKAKKISLTLFCVIFAIGLLYVFICSLDVLTAAFQLLAGRVAGDALSSNVILSNPIAGLVIGVLATVLLQSSSTSTSIVVTMVGSGVLNVESGIYIIMGANIGTSVTNTIVSVTQSGDKDTFRRSFAGATVHDMFNWLTVIILLPLEAASGYLFLLTEAIVGTITPKEDVSDEPDFLKVITDPLTSRIIKVDKGVLNDVAEGSDRAKYPICKYYCDFVYDSFNVSWPIGSENETFIEGIREKPWTINIELSNNTVDTVLSWDDINNQSKLCTHHFTGCGADGTWCSLNDQGVGGILFACSLFILLSSVIIMVKLLNYVLRGPIARAIRVGVNADLPGKAKFLTGYLAILMGAGLTMLVQSSTVFTSTMTPLVGLGLISVERMFPLTLGSNIGTCLTGILAALASDPDKIKNTLQVALAHLFFNISGIILFYPIPHLRKLPVKAAKFMGNTTAEYRWFAFAYIIVVFLLIPGAIFGLSAAGWKVLTGVLVPIGALIITIVIIKCMQHFCPQKMHPCMKNWQWLPKPLRSLEPCNNAITKCCYNDSCVRCRKNCCCEDDSDDEFDDFSSVSSSEPSPSGSMKHIDIALPTEPRNIETASIESDVVLNIGHSNPAYQEEIPVGHDFLESTKF